MQLNELQDNKGARKSRMRVGRGIGSGKGKTCGRGHKGQTSRSGVAIKGFEGGQMPIYRRLPKRGFKNPSRTELDVVNLGDLQKALDEKKFTAKDTVSLTLLAEKGLVRANAKGFKLLGNGELKSGLTIEATKASKSAQAAVEKAGGSVSLSQALTNESADA